MLKSLEVRNLTAFSQASLSFSPHLNILVGENGTGKSHLLKAAYSVLAVSATENRRNPAEQGLLPGFPLAPTKAVLQSKLADKLTAVFRPEALGRLARRQQGVSRSEIRCEFGDPRLDLAFSFSTRSKSEVVVEALPSAYVETDPVFLPTRELLTICPGFVSLYESRYLDFEETWRDTCALLAAPAVRGAREKRVRDLLSPLEDAMGGQVELDRNGRFHLAIPGQGRMEMHLVAEGLRKLAMLSRLIATGSLLDKGYLFWDEPEANLNPRLVRDVAQVILHLAASSIQVFIATHSLFLMRELHIQLLAGKQPGLSARFFGLQFEADGVQVRQGDGVDEIGSIASLDEELNQSQRYLEAEDAHHH